MRVKNIIASVHARLADRARNTNRPFQELLEYYGMERFLYRLSRSPHVERFVLKGALMLRVWNAPLARPTRDIDFLGRLDNSLENLRRVVQDVCEVAVVDDGLLFKAATVDAVRIKEDADYEGVRLRFHGVLGKAKIPMQIDVGFGDVVVPAPSQVTYPTILDFPGPSLKGYPRESVIAEKFEAMVKLGVLNSRMKDFYDVWLMSRQFDFDGPLLARAVRATFDHRRTRIDPQPVAFTAEFSERVAAATLWKAFLRRSLLTNVPERFADVVALVTAFLSPVALSCGTDRSFDVLWRAPGPWRAAIL